MTKSFIPGTGTILRKEDRSFFPWEKVTTMKWSTVIQFRQTETLDGIWELMVHPVILSITTTTGLNNRLMPESHSRVFALRNQGIFKRILTSLFVNQVNYLNKLILDIELHNVKGIKESFANGIDPNDTYKGEPLIYELTSEYTRSQQFKDCVRAFADAGLQMEDKVLLAVLLDDAGSLDEQLKKKPGAPKQQYTLRCAYTPLYKVSLLHICAEFNHAVCAGILVKHGADINAKAGTDEHGFGGETPIFHTVNQNNNRSADMLQFLLEQKADLHSTVPGLIWGKGYEWETFIPAVNPVSYAMMGLLPQMHRDEKAVAETVSLLLQHAYGIRYLPGNVPNAYLHK